MTSSAKETDRFSHAAEVLPQGGPVSSPRLPGLDWLRTGAAFAVVALHAGIPYMTHPLPALEWSVRSSGRSAVVDAVCWAINGAVMPIFFLMGGYLAASLWMKNPGMAFVRHRSRRLLAPLALAFLIVLPLDMYVWLIGWFTQGLIPWKKVLSLKLPSPLSEQFWGVAHLWYLECLWTLSIGACAFMTIAKRCGWPGLEQAQRAKPRGVHAEQSSWTTLTALALAAGLILACDPTFLLGFQQTWWPRPAAVAFYALFFVAGWRTPTSSVFSIVSKPSPLAHDAPPSPANLAVSEGQEEGPTTLRIDSAHRTIATRRRMGRRHETHQFNRVSPPQAGASRFSTGPMARLLIGLALFPFLLPLIHRHVETPVTGLPLVGLATLFSAYAWLVATSLFDLARASRARSVPKPVAFVAEASFWMYLIHHPLAGLTQLALLNVAIPPEVKFAVTLAASAWLSLATYAVLVRSTWIGRLLDGRGVSKRVAPVPEMVPVKEPLRQAA